MEKISLNSAKPAVQPMSYEQGATELAQSLKKTSVPKRLLVGGLIAAVVLGLGTGYVAASKTSTTTVDTSQTTNQTDSTAAAPAIKVGQVFGSKDAGAFKDQAEGVLVVGGVGGEGSHHLLRPGGASQNVYQTSSVMDLSQFENARVKVFGETFKAQKAGWLMDVGRVEVLELNAKIPDWAQKAVDAGTGQSD